MTAPIEYHTTDIREVEQIRPLWVQLNEHHRLNARTFRSQYERMTFEDRKAYFRKVAAIGIVQIDLAFDPETGRYVGYCVSSLSKDKAGEIESIYVEEGYRSQGIGAALMERALKRLDAGGSVRNRVSVGDGNEVAFGFYRKFGFFPRMTVLEQTRE